MEVLQQILDGLVAGFWAVVDLLAPVIAALVGGIFDVVVSPDAARGFTTVLVVLIGAWAISKAFLRVTKSPAIRPMKVEHYTDKTPAQVVLEQLGSTFMTLMVIGAVLLVLYYVGGATIP